MEINEQTPTRGEKVFSGRVVTDQINGRINIYDADNNIVTAIGNVEFDPTLTERFGIIMSRAGIDLRTADKRDILVDTTRYTTLKVSLKGSVTAEVFTNYTIPHNLGYIPICFVYDDSHTAKRSYFIGSNPSSFGWEADATNLYIYNNLNVDRIISYYICVEELL